MSGFLATGALLEDTGALIASETPIVLTPQSATILQITGNGSVGSEQILRLPDATKLHPGVRYYVANRSLVPAEVQSSDAQAFATLEPGFQGEFRLVESNNSAGTWDAAIYPSVKSGTEDLNLTLLKGGTWSWAGGELQTSADSFIQIPGLPLEVNRIGKFPDYALSTFTLPPDVEGSMNGQYILLNRPNGEPGYYLWFNVGGTGEDPGPFAGRVGYPVSVSANSSAEDLILALASSIDEHVIAHFDITEITSDTISVQNRELGKINYAEASSLIQSTLVNCGQNRILLLNEGNIAYTKIRRSANVAKAGTPLSIEIASSVELLDSSDADLWIFAQNIGTNRVLVGNSFRLVDGQEDELFSTGSAKGDILGSVQYNDGGNVITGDQALVWNPILKTLRLGDLHVTSLTPEITLYDNQVTPVNIASFDPSTYKNLVLEYSLIRNGKPQMGQLLIVHDGITASIADNFVAINSVGIDFLAGISGSFLVLAYQSTSTGHDASFRYSMRYWS